MTVLAALLLAAVASAAEKKVAVLELTNTAKITDAEANYLTDLVRDAAVRALSGRGFLVMTRENIYELLPPDMRDLTKCTEASCEVEAGRMIGADYLITGEVLRFADEFRGALKVHHSFSGAFLGGETCAGKTLKDLEGGLKEAAGRLLALVRDHAGVDAPAAALPATTPAAGYAPAGEADVIVKFESAPPGATVELGDQPLCETPCSRVLPAGSRDLAMKRVNYFPRREAVQVKAGMPTVKWDLSPRLGGLKVAAEDEQGNALEGDVLVDGEAVGRTYAPLSVITGTHEVRVEADAKTGAQRVEIVENRTQTVKMTLEDRINGAAPGWLGLTARDLTPSEIADANADKHTARFFTSLIGASGFVPKDEVPGVLVTSVAANGPAARAGIRAGDMILSLDGTRTTSAASFHAAIGSKSAGEKIVIQVRRDGRPLTVQVRLLPPPGYASK